MYYMRWGKVVMSNQTFKEILYRTFGFKRNQSIEEELSKYCRKVIWAEFIDCLKSEMSVNTSNTYVVTNIVNMIANKDPSSGFSEVSHIVSNKPQDAQKKRLAIEQVTNILKKVHLEVAFNELTEIKKEAENILKSPLNLPGGDGLPGVKSFEKTVKYIDGLEKMFEARRSHVYKLLLFLKRPYHKADHDRSQSYVIGQEATVGQTDENNNQAALQEGDIVSALDLEMPSVGNGTSRVLCVTDYEHQYGVSRKSTISPIEALKSLPNNAVLKIETFFPSRKSIFQVFKSSDQKVELSLSGGITYELDLRMINKGGLEVLLNKLDLILTDPINSLPTVEMPILEQRSGKNKKAFIELAECVAQEDSIQVSQPESLVNIRDNNRRTQLVDESSQPTQENSGIDAMDDSDDDEHFYDAVQYMNSEEAHSANAVSSVSSNHREIQLNESLSGRNQVFDQSILWNGLKVQEAKNENNDMKARLQESGSKGKGVESQKEKFFEASTNSKKQSNYPSVSFILSGVFAVGASLTMSHLAICISLTVAALTFLAVGCYCLYKASTALSNVQVDQIRNGVNPTASGAQMS